MMTSHPETIDALLLRARSGDHSAVHALIERNLEWLQARVRRRLNATLRREMDSGDLLHDVVASLLTGSAGQAVQDEEHFRALLVRVIDADVRDRLRWQRRDCRDRRREQVLPGDGSSTTGTPVDSVTRPSEHIDRNERTAWIRAAMLRLAPDEQSLLQQRVWGQRSFVAIAAELGIAEDAVRMRVNRALAKLARAVAVLRGATR